MAIQISENQREWDSFVLGFVGDAVFAAPFHQLWSWGEFEKSRGEDVLRLVRFESSLFAQAIIHKLPFGYAYAWVPRIMFDDAEFESAVVDFLKRKYKLLFCQFEYSVLDTDFGAAKSGNLKARIPEETIIVNLSKEPAEILNLMKPKWRYNANLAKKKGVKISIVQKPDKKDIEKFVELLEKTGKRNKFDIVPAKHIFELFDFFDRIYLAKAEFENKFCAGSVLLGAGNCLTYLHGASDYYLRGVMAPHLLHLESILFAKREGYGFYDFWGIALSGSKKEKEWAGITRFKEGFGGERVKYKKPKRIYIRPLASKVYELIRE